jgi:RNA polymerase sigma-70 factor, ECF subfamily
MRARWDQLIPVGYDELHRFARYYMAQQRSGHTLQAAALLNEAYLRLASDAPADFQGRAHFFVISARVMRRTLVDWARVQNASSEPGARPGRHGVENFDRRSDRD